MSIKNLLMSEMEEFFGRILGENILLATGFTERRQLAPLDNSRIYKTTEIFSKPATVRG